MAGQASEDDAVSVNVTPLIDIIFCLCIFFICSFHFKQLQGKLDSWLPKDKGNQGGGATTATMEDIYVRIYKNASGKTEVAYSSHILGELSEDDQQDKGVFDQVELQVKTQYKDYIGQGKAETATVKIDGQPDVPWKDVLQVLDRCKHKNPADPNDVAIDKVEFVQPMPA